MVTDRIPRTMLPRHQRHGATSEGLTWSDPSASRRWEGTDPRSHGGVHPAQDKKQHSCLRIATPPDETACRPRQRRASAGRRQDEAQFVAAIEAATGRRRWSPSESASPGAPHRTASRGECQQDRTSGSRHIVMLPRTEWSRPSRSSREPADHDSRFLRLRTSTLGLTRSGLGAGHPASPSRVLRGQRYRFSNDATSSYPISPARSRR